MALISNFEKFGVTFENAYTKILNVEYSNSFVEEWVMSEDPNVPPQKVMNKALKIKFDAVTYPSVTSTDTLHSETYHEVFPTGDSLIESCYDYLKTLPKFDGAVDA
jgi:hypothetical protein